MGCIDNINNYIIYYLSKVNFEVHTRNEYMF